MHLFTSMVLELQLPMFHAIFQTLLRKCQNKQNAFSSMKATMFSFITHSQKLLKQIKHNLTNGAIPQIQTKQNISFAFLCTNQKCIHSQYVQPHFEHSYQHAKFSLLQHTIHDLLILVIYFLYPISSAKPIYLIRWFILEQMIYWCLLA